MDIFLLIAIASLAYCAYEIHKNPKRWLETIQYLPIVGCMLYARVAGISADAWENAFSFGGLLGLLVILILVHHRVLMDRLFLGVNLFLMAGAFGFLFNIEPIIEWYSNTKGGPFFTCILITGFLTTLFTKTGFIGKHGMSKDAIRYSSFLLLAVSFVALIWSIQTDIHGILYAVFAPYFALLLCRDQLEKHVS